MTHHVAPHKWADAMANRLHPTEQAENDAHADECPRCARARARVTRASQTFPILRQQSAPELPWDTVRARVHWAVSSGKRDKLPASRRLVPVFGLTALATGGIAVVLITGRTHAPAPPPSRPVVSVPAGGSAPTPVAPPAATQLAALVVRETGTSARRFEQPITAGDVLASGEARLDVQFDDASALALAPGSILSMRRLDSEQIELYLQQGTLDVTVSKRSPGQRFLVELATGRTVEVRGTQFRITETTTQSRVECAHGKVALRDTSGEVEIPGARKVEIGAHAQVSDVRPSELSATELKALVEATPMTLPVWPGAAQLAQTSAALDIASEAQRGVRVDGVELGVAPLRVRVMPGRHMIETADSAGRFRRAGWVDATTGSPARFELRGEDDVPSPDRGIASRRAQLHAGIDRARLASCTRAIAKSGVTDTFVKIEISVDETGAVQFLNVLDTDLPSATASCVRDVLADVHFAAGVAATFRDKLDL